MGVAPAARSSITRVIPRGSRWPWPSNLDSAFVTCTQKKKKKKHPGRRIRLLKTPILTAVALKYEYGLSCFEIHESSDNYISTAPRGNEHISRTSY